MDVQQLQKQHKDILRELFHEVSLKDDKMHIEFLDDYFRQLQDAEEGPWGFACFLATEYFKETETKINLMSKLLDEQTVDFEKIDDIIIRLKGGTACVGFRRLHNICIAFVSCCRNGKREECIWKLQQFKNDMDLLRNKLACLFQLGHLIVAAGGRL